MLKTSIINGVIFVFYALSRKKRVRVFFTPPPKKTIMEYFTMGLLLGLKLCENF